MKLAVGLTCLVAVFAFVFAEETDVITLNSSNFDEVIASNPLILVEFYAPWCGHCKKLAPEYAAAATELAGENIPLAAVDADAESNRDLGQRFGIRGYPTIKLFRKGVPTDYQGGRTKDELVAFMRKQNQPAVVDVAEADVATFSTSGKVVVVGYFPSRDVAEYSRFKEAGEELRDFVFGAVISGSETKLVLNKEHEDATTSTSLATTEEIVNFVRANSLPLIDELGPGNYKQYMEAKVPMGYFMVNNNERAPYVDMLVAAARKSRGKINWVWLDFAKYARHAERIGLTGKVAPAVAIDDLVTGKHFGYEAAVPTAEVLSNWVDSYLAGTLEPTIRSEEIPADNSGPVKVVVAKTFEQIVLDPTKDVFVEFYAPWCGHCKNLAPIYEEVGAALAGIPSVVVAKMDATANDVDGRYNVQSYPTLKYFPANKKSPPLDYNGERKKQSILNYIKHHASIPFELEVAKDEL